MIRVGLTGTVAAGKSHVGRLFEAWGASRIDADDLARAAVAPGTAGLSRVVEIFGPDVLAPDGSLDRAAVRQRAFSDDEARAALEGVVHAEVRRLRSKWREDQRRRGAPVVVEEIPLLFETGLGDDYDVLIVVDAPREVRRERARASRGWTPEEFDAIDDAQMSGREKREGADHVICTDGAREETERAARFIWDSLSRRIDALPERA